MAKYTLSVTRTTIETTSLELEGFDDTDWYKMIEEHVAATPASKINWELDSVIYDLDDEPVVIDDGGQ
jgi:hypothetical protein